MKSIFFISLGVILLWSAPVQSSSFSYDSVFDCEGEDRFNWYCEKQLVEELKPEPVIEKPRPEPEKVAEPEEKEQPEKEPKPEELEQFKEMQEKLQEKLQIAYINPTEENIKEYIAYQNMVMNKASVFTDTWQRAIWQTPELDYSQRFPIATMAKRTKRSMELVDENEHFQKLKEEGYAVFFFYSSTCSFCHQMAEPIKHFQTNTALEVLPITIDGIKLEDKFPGSVIDKGQAQMIGVKSTPSLYLVNMKDRSIEPIATGWVSVQSIRDRIYILTATEPGDNY